MFIIFNYIQIFQEINYLIRSNKYYGKQKIFF